MKDKRGESDRKEKEKDRGKNGGRKKDIGYKEEKIER